MRNINRTTKICKFCQTEIPKKEKICPNCRRTLKSNKFSIVLLIIVLLSMSLNVAINLNTNNTINDVKKQPKKHNKSIVAEYIDVTSKQGKAIDNILKKCEINNIKKIEHDPMLDEGHNEGDTGYRITCGNIKNIILCLNSKKKVCRIGYAGYPLYKNKKVVSTLSDYTFTSDELNKYQTMCMNTVLDILKSPSTAKFANYLDWGFSKNKKRIIVQGYVDSQNSFGAVIRSDFQFKITPTDDIITSFIFDGQELTKQ